MGYNINDIKIPVVNPREVKISLHRNYFTGASRSNEVVEVSLGCHVDGARLPYPSLSDKQTALAAVLKRISARLPTPESIKLEELKSFSRKWLEKNCKPLSETDIKSIPDWIESRPYPRWRKDELLLCYENMQKGKLKAKDKFVKCFIKAENYPAYKHARGIFSRADAFKVHFGPLCSAIEEVMYQRPEFIKHVPVKDRPKYIEEYFGTNYGPTSATDYTSFESSFTPEVMGAVDQVMFDFFLKNINDPILKDCIMTLQSENICVFKTFTLKITGARMSGEMNTSLSNGFANLMVMSYLCESQKLGTLKMVVEGDDALAHTSSGRFPKPEDFASLGFNVKMEIHRIRSSASFCGIIYDPQDLITVTDIRECIATFGWASARYKNSGSKKLKALLRCKSLSYLYQYPGCPVLQELALYGLRMTRSFDITSFLEKDRSMSGWEREQIMAANEWFKSYGFADLPIRDIPNNTRLLVEEKFGVSIEEQIYLEKLISEKNDLSPFTFDANWPTDWVHNYLHYTCIEGEETIGLSYFGGEDFSELASALPSVTWLNQLQMG